MVLMDLKQQLKNRKEKVMKYLIILTALLFATPVFSREIIVQPMVPDFNRGDGFMEEGSYANPYILMDSDTGEEVGRMTPMMPDLIPGDGFMEKGSFANPYVIETD